MSDKDKKTEKKGKGFLGTLKSLAFETTEDEGTSNEESVNSKDTESSGERSKYVYSNVNTSQNGQMPVLPNANGQFDEVFYKDLMKVMEDNNIEGVDYAEKTNLHIFSKMKSCH